MNEKHRENPNQIDLNDLICESVENALSRRQQYLDLEDDLLEVLDEDAKNIKGGLPRDIIVMGYFFK